MIARRAWCISLIGAVCWCTGAGARAIFFSLSLSLLICIHICGCGGDRGNLSITFDRSQHNNNVGKRRLAAAAGELVAELLAAEFLLEE